MDNKSIPENDNQAGLASPAAQGTGEAAPPLVGDGSVHSQVSPVVSVAVDDVGNILDVSRLTGNLTGTQGTVTAPSPAPSVRSPHGSVAGNGSMAVGSPSQMTTSSPSMVTPVTAAPVAGPVVDQAEARVMFPQGRLPSPTMEEIRREAKLHSLHSQLNNISERMKTEKNPKQFSDLQYRYASLLMSTVSCPLAPQLHLHRAIPHLARVMVPGHNLNLNVGSVQIPGVYTLPWVLSPVEKIGKPSLQIGSRRMVYILPWILSVLSTLKEQASRRKQDLSHYRCVSLMVNHS